jgi:hypothetical protein
MRAGAATVAAAVVPAKRAAQQIFQESQVQVSFD